MRRSSLCLQSGRAVVVVALAGALIFGTALPAGAVDPTYMVINYNTAQCADVYLGSLNQNAAVVQEPCEHYSEQRPSGRCLQVSGGSGASLIQATCNGLIYQQWVVSF